MSTIEAAKTREGACEDARALDPEHGIWIDGRACASSTGETVEVLDPATDTAIVRIASGSLADGARAVEAAAAAQPAWAATAPRERAEILRRAYDLMVRDTERLAGIIALENGKALPDARAEVAYSREFFRWFSEETVRSDGDYSPGPDGGTRTYVSHRPVGVASLITPWNFPAAMVTRKIAPALAAGCGAVLKPAFLTPLTSLAIVQLLSEAGVPDGVINLVPTDHAAELSNSWLANPHIKKVSFTGSTFVGVQILKEAAKRVVSASMELGGNAPFIVTPDADIDAAVKGAIAAKLRNGGQACTGANRFFVHDAVAEEFTGKLADAVRRLVVGMPFDVGTQMGPVVSRVAQAEMNQYVAEGLAEGGKIEAASIVPAELPDGYFFGPTVISGLSLDSELLKKELFGPIAPIAIWSDRKELLETVNSVDVGLASYIYSGDLRWALKFAEEMEVGMTAINRGYLSDPSAPFGGTKQSGLGREGARDGLREFQETQYFTVDWS